MRKHNVLTRLGGRPRKPGAAQRAMRLMAVGLLVLPQTVAPAVITVDGTDSTIAVDSVCSLREAIINANNNDQSGSTDCAAGAGPDTITLIADVTLTLVDNYSYDSDRGLPVISTDVTIGGGFTIDRDGGAPAFGIFAVSSSGTLSLVDTTVSGGSARRGGGINSYYYGTTTLTNSTVSGNDASFGGGINSYYYGTTTLTNSTVSGNSASRGGGINSYYYGTTTLTNSIVANSLAGGDCRGGGFIDGFNNFSEDGSCPGAPIVSGVSGVFGVDIDTTLANNGGPTETHALLAGSVAIDAVACGLTTDQRGVLRNDGSCDSGSYEFVPVSDDDSSDDDSSDDDSS